MMNPILIQSGADEVARQTNAEQDDRLGTLETKPPRLKRQLLGIHAIVSGTSFSKSALLAREWMQDVDPDQCVVDLYLVGGGACGRHMVNAASTTTAIGHGGFPGAVKIIRDLEFDDLIDGTAIAIGAGGASVGSTGQGGQTSFGSYVARGGINGWLRNGNSVNGVTGGPSTPGEMAAMISDLAFGRPGVGQFWPDDSVGPGSGAGIVAAIGGGGIYYRGGGASNIGSADMLPGGAHATDGQNAPAESLLYGSGGGNGRYNTTDTNNLRGGDGGFPGGGGGAGATYATGTAARNGYGAAGVIRLAVYEWRVD